jgi:hypothetical protein
VPSPSDHLAIAEALAEQAHHRLNQHAYDAVTACTALATLHVRAALARQKVAGDAPAPSARPPRELPEWCGTCNGPFLAMRVVMDEDGHMSRCPSCNPHERSSTPLEDLADLTTESPTLPQPGARLH